MRGFILSVICLALSGAVSAEPSSNVAWTPDTLAFVKKGNAGHGKELAAACDICHGGKDAKGIGPYLDGQLSTYLYKQLKDYKDEKRQGMMVDQAKKLSDQDMADLAAWYGGQTPVKGAGGADDPTGIVSNGDGKRMEPACASCHGSSGQGEKVDTPRLAGQKVDYLEQTLLAYKAGKDNGGRANDIYSRMRLIASKLSETEIKQLAAFYSKQD